MNPYGTTRQATGGNNYRIELPPKRHWWTVVPFRPCRPPTPVWIIDWPIEAMKEYMNAMSPVRACGVDSDANGEPGHQFGDATSGLMVPPGPLSQPGGSQVVPLPSGQRTWSGRMRQAGAGLRSILYSALYTGPAIITEFAWQFAIGVTTGDVDSWYAGVSQTKGLDQFKVPTASLPIPPGITMFDYSGASDNEAPRSGLASMTEFNGSGGPSIIHPNLIVPWESFTIWVMMNTIGVNASGLDWQITFQPAQVTQGGNLQLQGGNQYRSAQYFGGTWNQAGA